LKRWEWTEQAVPGGAMPAFLFFSSRQGKLRQTINTILARISGTMMVVNPTQIVCPISPELGHLLPIPGITRYISAVR
jgi:hypothetical protein